MDNIFISNKNTHVHKNELKSANIINWFFSSLSRKLFRSEFPDKGAGEQNMFSTLLDW